MNTDGRTATINIGGTDYKMVMSTRATKAIGKRYGGLENLGESLMKSGSLVDQMDEIIWLVTLLVNQGISIENYKNRLSQKLPIPEFKEEEVEMLTTPADLADCKDAILEAMTKGSRRNVLSEEPIGGSEGNPQAG